MKYLSVCSGIEAATVAWHQFGWTPLAFSEIEAFPRAVLANHYPDVPLHGDFTALREQDWIVDADLLVGGTPCQAFSVAGLRQSLSDDRGNLTLEFVRLADAIDNARGGAGRPPAIIAWENVPGVLSTRDNAFGCFLGALAGEDCPLLPAGKRWSDTGMVVGPARTIAWRVLDAQYFGLAQRRRRVFVVASADPGFDPAEVLFEREGLRRDTAPSRETGQGVARNPQAGAGVCGAGGGGTAVSVCPTLRAGGNSTGGDRPPGTDVDTADSLIMVMSHGQHKAEITTGQTPTLSCQHEAPILFESHPADSRITGPVDPSPTVTSRWGTGGNNTPLVSQPAVAFAQNQVGEVRVGDVLNTLNTNSNASGRNTPLVAHPAAAVGFNWANGGGYGNANDGLGITIEGTGPLQRSQVPAVASVMQVRRLTPVECERLQGFPDGYTAITWRNKPAEDCPDGPRYKALGNSMAVPVMRWIGKRIAHQVQ